MLLFALTLLAACSSPSDTVDDVTDTVDTPADTVDPVDTPAVDTPEADTPEVDTPVVDTPVDPTPNLPDDPCYDEVPVVHLGTGGDGFHPLTPGQDLEMVHGPQGGWHVWIAVRADHVMSQVAQVLDIVDVASGVSVVDAEAVTSLYNLSPLVPGPWACEGVHWAGLGLLDVDTFAPGLNPDTALCGHEVEIRVTLRHPFDDRPLLDDDVVRVILQPDPADGPHCTPP